MTGNVIIYIELLEEGAPVSRPTTAEVLGNNLYKVLPIPNYEMIDEIWKFPPGSIVTAEQRKGIHGYYLYAIQP